MKQTLGVTSCLHKKRLPSVKSTFLGSGHKRVLFNDQKWFEFEEKNRVLENFELVTTRSAKMDERPHNFLLVRPFFHHKLNFRRSVQKIFFVEDSFRRRFF